MKEIWLRFPGGRARALTLSYDDGVEQDRHLIELMERRGVKGTFNLNSSSFAPEGTRYPAGQVHRRLTQRQCLALYDQPGIEVAVHCARHCSLPALPSSAALLDVLEDRMRLEALYGRVVRGMAYPFGTFDAAVVDALRLAGIAYARTVRSTHSFRLPGEWLLLDPTCHHDDPELFNLWDAFLAERDDRDPLLFYLWGHAYEFEQHDNWGVIERFLERASGRDDVYYATNIELFEYVQAFGRLVYTADASAVMNPTSTELFVERGGQSYRLPAGGTLRFED